MVGRCDIYVGFIEAGLRQLKAGGALGFICADRWMRSAYGAELRRHGQQRSSAVEAVIEMHDAPAFEDEVAAYPAVVVLRRSAQSEVVVASAGRGAGQRSGNGILPMRWFDLADGRTRTKSPASPRPESTDGFAGRRRGRPWNLVSSLYCSAWKPASPRLRIR